MQDLYLAGKKDEAAAALPDDLIDQTSLCGPKERIAERLAVYREAGVGTLICTPDGVRPRGAQAHDPRPGGAGLTAPPPAPLPARRVRRRRARLPGHRPRPGAGGARPRRSASRRGGTGAITWSARAWPSPRPPSTRCGRSGRAHALPGGGARGTETTRPLVARLRPRTWWWPTSSPWPAALAAQMEGRPWATLIPHVLPTGEPGLPPYSVGRAPAAHAAARIGHVGPVAARCCARGEERGRRELNGARRRVGLAPLDHAHGGISRQLALVATFPQLEYPRHDWRPVRARDGAAAVGAPSTEVETAARRRAAGPGRAQHRQGPRAPDAACGARRPGRTSRCGCSPPPTGGSRRGRSACPPTRGWWTGSPTRSTMPRCAAVICHAGHGTVVRALACGVPVVAAPRRATWPRTPPGVAWAGCGISLPRRLVTPRGEQAGGAQAAGRAGLRRERGAELRTWTRAPRRRRDGGRGARGAGVIGGT